MKFQNYINEAFDKPAPWIKKGLGANKREITYSFNVKGKSFGVSFGETSDNAFHVVFWEENKTGNWDFDVTNKGDALTVFATVLDIIRAFVKEYDNYVAALIFDAEKPDISGEADEGGSIKKSLSRAKLYDRMVKKFLPAGWKVTIKPSRDDTSYRMLKKDTSKIIPRSSRKWLSQQMVAGE